MKRGPKIKISEVDFIRGRLWVKGALLISGLPNPTAIEHLVSPKSIKPRSSNPSGFISPCHFNQINRGEVSAGKKIVDKTNHKIPGSEFWYNHCFWEIIRQPPPSRSQLIYYLQKALPSDVNNLFKTQHLRNKNQKHFFEKNDISLAFEKLEQLSTWDSFCVVLIFIMLSDSDDEHDKTETLNYLIPLAIRIYSNFVSVKPFIYIAEELYEYLYSTLFKSFIPYLHNKLPSSDELIVKVGLYSTCLDFVDTLGLLKNHKRAPTSCLYIIKKLLFTNCIFSILSENIEDLTITEEDLTIIQEVADELTKWENNTKQNIT